MKFREMIEQGLQAKKAAQARADRKEKAIARSKGGPIRSRNRPVPTEDQDTRPKLMAYQGKEDCTSWSCRRLVGLDEPGCLGWHCAICHEPSSQYGHEACRQE